MLGRWFRHGPVQALADNRNVLNRQGLSMRTLWVLARGEADDDTIRKNPYKHIKTKFQRTVTRELMTKVSVDPETTMRNKLGRWNLLGIPRVTARPCIEALAVLRRRSPPGLPRPSSGPFGTLGSLGDADSDVRGSSIKSR